MEEEEDQESTQKGWRKQIMPFQYNCKIPLRQEDK